MKLLLFKYLLLLKKKFPSIWNFIEFINGQIFRVFYHKRIQQNSQKILRINENDKYSYRFLNENDLKNLFAFFQKQNQEQFQFFKPHKFDIQTLNKIFNNPSYFLFGVFDQNKIVGYYFLRCFINKQCFTGRLVDEKYQGQSIAKKMGEILHHIAWSSNFRVFGTASKENIKSLKSYQAINNYRIIKELDNNYIYFEYLESEEKAL